MATGAPVLVIAKLLESDSATGSGSRSGDWNLPGAVSASGDRVSVTSSVGGAGGGDRIVSEAVDCDSVYSATQPWQDVCSDAVSPILQALLEGVNTLLILAANDATAGHNAFTQAPCMPGTSVAGISGYAVDAIFSLLAGKREALVAGSVGMGLSPDDAAGVFEATVALSYGVVTRDAFHDALDRDAIAAGPAAGAPVRLQAYEDDAEGVFVRGLTTYGPIPTPAAAADLLATGHAQAARISASASGPAPCSSFVKLTVAQSIRCERCSACTAAAP